MQAMGICKPITALYLPLYIKPRNFAKRQCKLQRLTPPIYPLCLQERRELAAVRWKPSVGSLTGGPRHVSVVLPMPLDTVTAAAAAAAAAEAPRSVRYSSASAYSAYSTGSVGRSEVSFRSASSQSAPDRSAGSDASMQSAGFRSGYEASFTAKTLFPAAAPWDRAGAATRGESGHRIGVGEAKCGADEGALMRAYEKQKKSKATRRSVLLLHNKKAGWDPTRRANVLNFQGRVTESSAKNFQLVAEVGGHSVWFRA